MGHLRPGQGRPWHGGRRGRRRGHAPPAAVARASGRVVATTTVSSCRSHASSLGFSVWVYDQRERGLSGGDEEHGLGRRGGCSWRRHTAGRFSGATKSWVDCYVSRFGWVCPGWSESRERACSVFVVAEALDAFLQLNYLMLFLKVYFCLSNRTEKSLACFKLFTVLARTIRPGIGYVIPVRHCPVVGERAEGRPRERTAAGRRGFLAAAPRCGTQPSLISPIFCPPL